MRGYPKSWQSLLVVPAVVSFLPSAGYATVYLSIGQAQQVIFPGETFTAIPLTLTDEQRSAIKKKSGVPARVKEQRIWRTSSGGYFIVDEVVGKHEFITYAIGLNADGSVKQIEIMDYRETYGYEIRNESWRKQFVGKTSAAELKLDKDIKNIGGATLSCRHITDGVKRVLTLYELFLKNK